MKMICMISLVAITAAASAQYAYDDRRVELPYYAQPANEPASSYTQTYRPPNQPTAGRAGLTSKESYPTKESTTPYPVYPEPNAPYSVYPPAKNTYKITYQSYQTSEPTTTTGEYEPASSEESYPTKETTKPYPVYPEPAIHNQSYQTDKPAYKITYPAYQTSELTTTTEGYEPKSYEESYPRKESTTPYPVYPEPATRYPVYSTEKPAYIITYPTYQTSETPTNAKQYESPSSEESYPTKESTTRYPVYQEPAKRYPVYQTDKPTYKRTYQIYQTSEPTTTTDAYEQTSSKETYSTKESTTPYPVYPEPAKRYPVYQTSEPTTTTEQYKSLSSEKSYPTRESTRPYRIPSPTSTGPTRTGPTRKTKKPQY